MGLKKDILERLDKIERGLDLVVGQNNALKQVNEVLLAERKELLDRIMAVDYQKYQLYSTEVRPLGNLMRESRLDEDDELAGEIVERMD